MKLVTVMVTGFFVQFLHVLKICTNFFFFTPQAEMQKHHLMKNTVLEYFKNLPQSKKEQFNQAFALYGKCNEKSLSAELFYNRSGYSPANLQALQYDLKKLFGITEAQIRNFTSDKKEALKVDVKTVTPSNQEISKIKTSEDVFTKAPDEVKEAVKLRDEFPFLKEANCPDELLILVGKKFNHYDAYVKAHEALLVVVEQDAQGEDVGIALSPEQITNLALSAVENFQVNQDIWDELNYYKENKKVLGKHPIFLERKLKESIDALTVEKATKRISNLENYIRRDNKKLEKASATDEKEKYTQKVKGWEIELGLIKTKFGFTDEK